MEKDRGKGTWGGAKSEKARQMWRDKSVLEAVV